MVLVQTGLDTTEGFALNFFDTYGYMAVGSGVNSFSPGQTTLITEQVRNLLESATKNTLAGTYIFVVLLGLSEGNGFTLTEVGLFDAASSGNMSTRNILPVSVVKTSDFKLRITLTVTVTAVNV